MIASKYLSQILQVGKGDSIRTGAGLMKFLHQASHVPPSRKIKFADQGRLREDLPGETLSFSPSILTVLRSGLQFRGNCSPQVRHCLLTESYVSQDYLIELFF